MAGEIGMATSGKSGSKRKVTKTQSGVKPIPVRDYDGFLAALQMSVNRALQVGHTIPLFTVDTTGLYDTYINEFDVRERQHYRCHACKRFLEVYGGLVTVNEKTGTVGSILWGDPNEFPESMRDVVTALRLCVQNRKIEGVALFNVPTWGTPLSGTWRHMSIQAPYEYVYKPTRLKTTEQAIAEKKEEHAMVSRALGEYPRHIVRQALTILEADALYRAEKVIGAARWFDTLYAKIEALAGTTPVSTRGRRRSAIIWNEVAKAPVGYAHIKSHMIGSLLDDLKSGLALDEVKKRFDMKMQPDKYQRPVAPPKAGTINRAETIMRELHSQGALSRRFATLRDIEAIWKYHGGRSLAEVHAHTQTQGVFGHLRTPDVRQTVDVPGTMLMTWEKFHRTVLPSADKVEFMVPSLPMGFCAFTTAVHPHAPPILQWDDPVMRNPVSWYDYRAGSYAHQWRLLPGWRKVTAVTFAPAQWSTSRLPLAHFGQHVMFLIEGCRETRHSGAGLFPETLKSEYHEIRSVIEAYSHSAQLEGMEAPDVACGVVYSKGQAVWRECLVRVTTREGYRTSYKLDRWD